jgi:rhodanese-related sulfurtransferase
MEAADILAQHGFQALGYPGGIQEWAESGLPVEGNQVK